MNRPLRAAPFRLQAPRGASLIEAMAALVVFTIGILGVLQMNVLASAQSNVARSNTLATTIARDMVDAFERLPYDHPAFVPGSTSYDDAAFIDLTHNTGELHTLTDDFSDARPITSSAYAIVQLEQKGAAEAPFTVAWRVGNEQDPEDPTVVQAKRIAIMVTYPTPLGQRQVTVWTARYNPVAMVGSAGNLLSDGGTTSPPPEI